MDYSLPLNDRTCPLLFPDLDPYKSVLLSVFISGKVLGVF